MNCINFILRQLVVVEYVVDVHVMFLQTIIDREEKILLWLFS